MDCIFTNESLNVRCVRLTISVEELHLVVNAVFVPLAVGFFVLLDEADEGRPLHLDRLAVLVEQSSHKVEEVALSQVVGRLLLKVSPTKLTTAMAKDVRH